MRHGINLLFALSLAGLPAVAAAQTAPAPGGRPAGAPGAGPTGQAPQASGQIRGAVLGPGGQPIAQASVSVHSGADNALVTGALTVADGSFRIEGLRPGSYTVRVAALGYTTVTRPGVSVSPTSLQIELGRVELAASAVQIEGLSVTAERRDVTLAPDRNTYTVRDMPATTGGSAVDVLRNVPSVEVDGDNMVSLRGNQNVVVQINGRPTPMRGEQLGAFLAQLSANLVEKVEVVPNPSAKYDPEGMAGIVNIQLKQNTDLGTSGGLVLGGGSTGQVSASGNLGYQSGPLTLFGSYGFMNDQRESVGFNNRESLLPSAVTFLNSDSRGTESPLSHTLNASAEYRLGDADAISTSLVLSNRDFERENLNVYRELDASRALTGSYNQLTEGASSGLMLDATVGYKHVAEPQRNELSTELRFNRSTNDNVNLFTRQELNLDGSRSVIAPELERNATDGVNSNLTLQADYTRVLGERTKVEAGYKGALRQLDNAYDASAFSHEQDRFVTDPARANAFEFGEQVHAAYGVVSQNMGMFDLQAGLRLEQATTQFDLSTTGESFTNDYRSFFPSALIAFNPDDSHQIKVSYSKRVERPRTEMLNPFGRWFDSMNRSVGNPYLTPEYTHAFELGYQQSFDFGSLQVTPFFRHTTDAVRRIRELDDAGVTTMTFANVATSDSYGADLNGSLRLGPVSAFGGFSAFQQVTDASNLSSDLSNQAFGWSARANATWKLSDDLDVQGMLMYRAPMTVEQGRMSSMSMTNVALRQKVLGDRASVTLRVTDPFNTMGMGSVFSDDRYYQISERSMGARGVSLSFSYNFGQQPRVRQARPAQQEPQGEDMGM